ncbi:glycosyltransferase family 2 protein [Streptomyces sp. NPDC005146]
MTVGRPSIGILTPSRNYGRYLEDTVLSVAAQSYPGLEHVVQDGASTDGTDRLLAEMARRLPRMSCQVVPDDGQSDALNRAAGRATSELFGWLNADEFYLPGAVAAAGEVLAAEPDVDVVYGDCALVDASGRFLRLLPAHEFSRFTLRYYGCFIPSCATFIRRTVLPDPGWDPRMRRLMDWDLWLSLDARGARFRYLPRALAAFRVHDAQVTSRPEALDAAEFDLLRVRHDLPRRAAVRQASGLLGRAAHVGEKLRTGGFSRQVRAARVAGAGDLRWWLTAGAHHRAHRLVEL